MKTFLTLFITLILCSCVNSTTVFALRSNTYSPAVEARTASLTEKGTPTVNAEKTTEISDLLKEGSQQTSVSKPQKAEEQKTEAQQSDASEASK